MPKNIPILVGVAQHTHRPQSVDEFISPIDLMAGVVIAAAEDAGCPRLAREADALHVVGILAWSAPDPPGAVAETLDCQAALREYRMIGGDSPQWYVNRAADSLAAGRSQIAILTGCEVMRSATLTQRAGTQVGEVRGWKVMVDAKPIIPLVGDQRYGIHDIEKAHGADRAVRLYPFIENALRVKADLTFDEQRAELGRFGEESSRIAAGNPYAWFHERRTAEEAITATTANRMIAFPYTKFLCAMNQVDQAAALIMTTTETARRLGIPESRWVYPAGGQESHDVWFLGERADLADSPAISAATGDALDQAGATLDDIDFFDFYSCFPCMPRMTRRVLGIDADDPRPSTITGGLSCFGGPGNNYTMHAIATAVDRIRKERDALGLVSAVGWYSTKHNIGVYSGHEPTRAWSRTPPEEFQRGVPLLPPLEIDLEPRGMFTVDSYTVCHDRSGEPEFSILLGRTPEGRRAWAQTPRDDGDVLEAMMREEWIGREGRIAGREGEVNVVEF